MWKRLNPSTAVMLLTTVILFYFFNTKFDVFGGIRNKTINYGQKDGIGIRNKINNYGQREAVVPLTKEQWMEMVNQFGPKAVDRGYGSHSVVLLAAVAVTTGDIVEFGSGFHSTPMLHNYTQLIHDGKRKLLTADTDPTWLSKFKEYASEFHTLLHVANPSDWSNVVSACGTFEYGVIFIDHAPGERRGIDVARLSRCAQLVVVHDTDFPHFYRYERGLIRYQYVHDFGKIFGAGVAVLSNYDPNLVNEVKKLIAWYRFSSSQVT